MTYFAQNPTGLDINIGGKTGTIRVLVGHIFQVEYFFANKLLQPDSSSRPELSTLGVRRVSRLKKPQDIIITDVMK